MTKIVINPVGRCAMPGDRLWITRALEKLPTDFVIYSQSAHRPGHRIKTGPQLRKDVVIHRSHTAYYYY